MEIVKDGRFTSIRRPKANFNRVRVFFGTAKEQVQLVVAERTDGKDILLFHEQTCLYKFPYGFFVCEIGIGFQGDNVGFPQLDKHLRLILVETRMQRIRKEP